jgi:hypothetical protein
MMTPHYTKKKTKYGFQNYFYYRCSRTMHHNNSICSIRQIAADRIEKMVVDDIGRLISESPTLLRAIESANSERIPNSEPFKSELEVLRKRLEEIEREAERTQRLLGKASFLPIDLKGH